MNSYIKSFFIILGFFLVFSSLNTVSYKSDIFASSSIPTCQFNGCIEGIGIHCLTNVSAFPSSLCENITVTCKRCVDLTISNCLCYPGTDSCKYTNGTSYYGQLVTCDIN